MICKIKVIFYIWSFLNFDLVFSVNITNVENDYWSDLFNKTQNCKSLDLMKTLWKDPKRCAHVTQGKVRVQLEECKKLLAEKLISSCPNIKIEKVDSCSL